MRSYTVFELGNQQFCVAFKQSFWRGITEAVIYSSPSNKKMLSKTAAVIKSTTPSALVRAKEVVLRKKILLLEKAKSKFYEQ